MCFSPWRRLINVHVIFSILQSSSCTCFNSCKCNKVSRTNVSRTLPPASYFLLTGDLCKSHILLYSVEVWNIVGLKYQTVYSKYLAMSISNMFHILLTCCLLRIRLIRVNCVVGILCTLLCWLVALSWCGMYYANGLSKIFWLYMMSILQIHLENISVASGVALKTNL